MFILVDFFVGIDHIIRYDIYIIFDNIIYSTALRNPARLTLWYKH